MSAKVPTCEDMCSFMETLQTERPPLPVAAIIRMEPHAADVVFDLDEPSSTRSSVDKVPGSGLAGRVVHERRSPREWYLRKHPELDYARPDKVIEVFGVWSPELMNRNL